MILIGMVLLCLILIPYAKVEILTVLHKDEFPNILDDIGMIDNMEYFKVMAYSKNNAEILCIGEGHTVSVLVKYKKNQNIWYAEDWSCIYSKSGTADDFIWPYYR